MSENEEKKPIESVEPTPPVEPEKPNWLKRLTLVTLFITIALSVNYYTTKDKIQPPAKGYNNTELVQKTTPPDTKAVKDYSQFVADYKQPGAGIAKIFVLKDGITIVVSKIKPEESYKTYSPVPVEMSLVNDLTANGIPVQGIEPETPSFFSGGTIMMGVFILAIVLISVWQSKRQAKMQEAQIKAQRDLMDGKDSEHKKTTKSKAEKFMPGEVTIRFSDVAGVDIHSVSQILEFLSHPEKYGRLGGKIPKGCLFVGPPGCGKTLLAKAVAGEASTAFFSVSASELVEMFVGVGAARVRGMFEEARACGAPAIIFIDEIDAIGRSRSSGHGNNNDEREQTLNQLLTEMDGFKDNKFPIIVLAATNRPDILDKALTRPGRFDRQVTLPLPDVKGRFEILKVHVKEKVISPLVNLLKIAQQYIGASGADLANLVNEAVMRAEERNGTFVTMKDFEDAKDHLIMGKAREGDIMDDDEKRNTAFHEAGHVIVGMSVPGTDPVYKVSIEPRDKSLGQTVFIPEREQVSMSFEQAESRIAMMYAGRVAEVLLNGPRRFSSGASNDYERATQFIDAMITRWGFYYEQLGHLVFASEYGDHLATSVRQGNYSNETGREIDTLKKSESKRIYDMATKIMTEKWKIAEVMAEALLKWNTLDRPQIDAIMAGKPLEEIPEPAWMAELENAVKEEALVAAEANEATLVDLTKKEGKE